MPMAGPRSLVIAPQWIGDAVMTEPLVSRLRDRGEHITVAALPWVAPVYRAMPGLAAVVDLPFRHGALQWAERQALGRTWRGQFDRAYVCPNSLKSALLPWMASIPVRVGYRGEFRLGLLTHRLPNPPRDHRPPMVDFYAALADVAVPAGAGQPVPPHSADSRMPDGRQRPRLQIPPARMQAACQAHGLTLQGHVVMAPGAEYGPAKRWPVAHFAQVAAQLTQDVVLLGSAKDRAVCEAIVALAQPGKVRGRLLNLAGQTSLEEAFALIASAHRMLSNDSGLMHVAAALDVPQVAVFGSSSPDHTPPLSPRATVIWLKRDAQYQPALDCAPCFERECPRGHLRCLQDISPERVLQALSLTAPGDVSVAD
jgi:heptosyltransferase-2